MSNESSEKNVYNSSILENSTNLNNKIKAKAKKKEKKEIIIKLKHTKSSLKEVTKLENYKNNKILNANKKGKKKKSNSLQDKKFSIDTLAFSFSTFNPKISIFQESDLLISQKSIKQNNIIKSYLLHLSYK